MAEELSGKIAALTSAASGIGLVCVKAMLPRGAMVFFVDCDRAALDGICGGIRDRAVPLVVDLLDREAVATMLPKILGYSGHLDIFHANAGAHVGGDIVEGDPDVRDRRLNLTVNPPFRSRHGALGNMVERKTGGRKGRAVDHCETLPNAWPSDNRRET
jgi:ribitol 2-dehydrogenase